MRQLLLGEILKQEGIDQAQANADRSSQDWSDLAYECLVDYVNKNKVSNFMAEDVRYFALRQGLQEPPNNRAWGSVILRAKRNKLIQFYCYDQVMNPTAHRANAIRWEKIKRGE